MESELFGASSGRDVYVDLIRVGDSRSASWKSPSYAVQYDQHSAIGISCLIFPLLTSEVESVDAKNRA